MAAKKKEFKAVARQQIKYGGEYIQKGQEFKVNEKDVEELKQYADIEESEATSSKDNTDNKEDGGTGEKEGE